MFLSEITSNAPQFFYLVPWIVFFPVIGLLVNIVFGGKLSEKWIGFIACMASGLSFLISILMAVSLMGHHSGEVVFLADWIQIGKLDLRWAFQIDTLSTTMMLVVSGIGTLIHIYAVGYMHKDVRHHKDPSRFRRFFVFMNLFIAVMMILVSSDNYLMLFVGWEGVGLCSYLLIGFWYDKGEGGIGNAKAANKAFVTNRIGDLGFLIASFIMFGAFGTLEFKSVFEQAPAIASATPWVIMAITMFMLLGVAGKSAQIPLFVWLPDAMAGPTPVSALIHAATMVTAGVYLVARSQALYTLVPAAQGWVTIIGAVTAIFAATIAIAQFDIKKVLAYSTISQLGFMVAAVGMGAFVAGMFHLVTHAFFKALLFLSAGSVIQGVEEGHHHVAHDQRLAKSNKNLQNFDPQDMRNMGGLRSRMKVTFWVYLIGAIALAGIPPLAGFWSKDEILAEASHLNPTAYWLLTIAAFFTAFYMGRQVLMIFFGKPRTAPAEHAKENPPIMTVPLIILAILALFGGALNLPSLHTFSHWLEHTFEHVHVGEFDLVVAGISTGLALLAVIIAWLIYSQRYQEMLKLPTAQRADDPLRPILGPVFTAMENKWWVDEFYQATILNPYKAVSKYFAEVIDWRFWHDWFHDRVITAGFKAITSITSIKIDLGIIDAAGDGLARLIDKLSGHARRLQTGFVRTYALSIFFGVVIIISYLIFR